MGRRTAGPRVSHDTGKCPPQRRHGVCRYCLAVAHGAWDVDVCRLSGEESHHVEITVRLVTYYALFYFQITNYKLQITNKSQ